MEGEYSGAKVNYRNDCKGLGICYLINLIKNKRVTALVIRSIWHNLIWNGLESTQGYLGSKIV